MTEAEVLELLEQSGAFLKGHFVLSSGLHSGEYIQCAQLLQYPERAEAACRALAESLRQANCETPAAVIGPALGGVVFAYELARQLRAKALFAERVDGRFHLRRGFSLSPGESVIVAEDVITTGGSAQEVVSLAEKMGARPIAVAALVDRSGGAALGAPLHALIRLSFQQFSPEDCPLCRQGLPLVKPGSRPGPPA
jgi:orotate phosphoribosyltransferase